MLEQLRAVKIKPKHMIYIGLSRIKIESIE